MSGRRRLVKNNVVSGMLGVLLCFVLLAGCGGGSDDVPELGPCLLASPQQIAHPAPIALCLRTGGDSVSRKV